MGNTSEDPSMEHELKRCLAPKYKLANVEFTDEGTVYSCVECLAAYSDKDKLEAHLCSHYKEYRFLCGICGTGLKRKEHLDRHILGHQEVRPHVCDDCGKGFKRKEHLNIHRSIHSGDKTHLCALCNRSFYRKDHLQKHLQTHSKMFMEQNLSVLKTEFVDIKKEVYDDLEPVEDMECEVSMEVEEDNSRTEVEPPKDPTRPFECCICHKTYKRKDHLKLHSVTHMKKDKICSECGKAFHREEQLLVHMHTHLKAYDSYSHPPAPALKEEAPPAPALQDIHAAFDHSEIDILPLDDTSLLVPRLHYGPDAEENAATAKRPHECHICHRRFKRKQHLKVHANVHQKPVPTIWCSLCNEGFHKNDQFEKHQCPGHVLETDPHAVRSEDAKKENHPHFEEEILPSETFLNEPIMSLVEEKDIPTPQKVYVCKFCSKPFKRKDHYKIHLHIHTGVKSFFCPDCGKGFYRKDHLHKHLQVHVRGKPFTARLTTPAPAPAPPAAPKPAPSRRKRQLPDLYPINMLSKKEVRPEITITAPSNSALRVPLQIKVPYQVVMAMDNGEQRAVTIDPTATTHLTVT